MESLESSGDGSLLILWTTGDRETALNMVLMYGLNALLQDWWGEVTLLVWGASQELAVEDEEVRDRLAAMEEAGVELVACKSCALNLGLVDELSALGCEVRFTGQFLTDWIKSGKPMLSI